MRRVPLIVLGFVFCLWIAPLGRAQDSTTLQQDTSSSPIIDGAVHPELIPDSAAYRMYFVSISIGANPADADQKGQQARLNAIGLEDADREILASAMADFRAKHDALIAQYNQAATARSEPSDVNTLLRQLDQLVQNTRDTLKARLSSKGMTQFDAFVQSEKRHMKVQTGAS